MAEGGPEDNADPEANTPRDRSRRKHEDLRIAAKELAAFRELEWSHMTKLERQLIRKEVKDR
jgi:hypothetical protein